MSNLEFWRWTLAPLCGLSLFLASAGAGEPGVEKRTAATLQGRIVEGATGVPLAARVYIRDAAGNWHFPRSVAKEGSALEYRRQAGQQSVEMHTTLSAHPFEADLPKGKYRMTVQRGKEYLPLTREFEIGDKPLDLALVLDRWIDMPARGWYSGDTHIHRPAAELANVALAEDIHVTFPLSYWVTQAHTSSVRGNRVTPVEAAPHAVTLDATHLVYPLNTEYELFTVDGKNHTLGAVLAIGHRTPLEDGAPPVAPLAAKVHGQGGLIDLEKHNWPWSAMIVPVMEVDLFELANNHIWETDFGFPKWYPEMAPDFMQIEKNESGLTERGWIDFGFKTYYAFLNCGFRLMPTAGTAAGVHPVPAGFGRVYVHRPDGLSVESWLHGLKAGRSFVTTGPMLFAECNGRPSGDTLSLPATGGQVRVQGTVESGVPLDRVEIIVNGKLVRTMRPSNTPRKAGGFAGKFDEQLAIAGSSWLAVRAFEEREGRPRFAHTAPWFVDVPGKPLVPPAEEVDYFIGRIHEELARNRGVLAAEELAEFEQALAVYRRLKP